MSPGPGSVLYTLCVKSTDVTLSQAPTTNTHTHADKYSWLIEDTDSGLTVLPHWYAKANIRCLEDLQVGPTDSDHDSPIATRNFCSHQSWKPQPTCGLLDCIRIADTLGWTSSGIYQTYELGQIRPLTTSSHIVFVPISSNPSLKNNQRN